MENGDEIHNFKRGGKSILNELKNYGIDDHTAETAESFYKQIINSNLELHDKDLIFRKKNFIMFMYWCCYAASCYHSNGQNCEMIPDMLMKKFGLNKGDLQKIPSLFSKIKLNCNLPITNVSINSYFTNYVEKINNFSNETKKKITIELSPENKLFLENCKRQGIPCSIQDNIEGFDFNEDIVDKMVKFSKFVMHFNPEIKSSSPSTAYAGIFAYYMIKILGINIQHRYLDQITNNSYATDSKNIHLISKTIDQNRDSFGRFYERFLR